MQGNKLGELPRQIPQIHSSTLLVNGQGCAPETQQNTELFTKAGAEFKKKLMIFLLHNIIKQYTTIAESNKANDTRIVTS